MEKQLLDVKATFENGQFKIEKFKLPETIGLLEQNLQLSYDTEGYLIYSEGGCKCPPSNIDGTYECIGGNCVFFPH